MTKDLNIGIAGGAGRMGKMLIAEVARAKGCRLAAASVHEHDPHCGRDAGEVAGIGRMGVSLQRNAVVLFEQSDVVIDFTTPAASLEHCLLAHRYNRALVIGTTGFNPAQNEMLRQHAKAIPILGSPNMSLGVNLLIALTEQLAGLLDNDYDVEIFEMHHRHKVDAPSGTALALGQAAARGRGVTLDDIADHSRNGVTGARKPGHIGFSVARGGDVIGDHVVTFAADGERLEIAHRASNRAIYARGAVRAAQWLAGKKPGLYTMRDVLGFGDLGKN